MSTRDEDDAADEPLPPTSGGDQSPSDAGGGTSTPSTGGGSSGDATNSKSPGSGGADEIDPPIIITGG